MISNPRLLFYSCVAKGTVILAEFASKEDPGIEDLALRCIENVPPHHSMISHTVHKRTYALIIDGLFSYFTVLDEAIAKSESIRLFNRLKSATESLVSDSLDNPSQYCLQSKLDPVFAEIAAAAASSSVNQNKDLDLELNLGMVGSPRSITKEDNKNNQSVDSSRGTKGGALMPLLGKPLRVLKNKKRTHSEDNWNEKKMDIGGGGGGNKGVRNGLLLNHDHHRQKAKQIWKKHVWIVLMFDLCICIVLFGIWLWICQGFQCIEG